MSSKFSSVLADLEAALRIAPLILQFVAQAKDTFGPALSSTQTKSLVLAAVPAHAEADVTTHVSTFVDTLLATAEVVGQVAAVAAAAMQQQEPTDRAA